MSPAPRQQVRTGVALPKPVVRAVAPLKRTATPTGTALWRRDPLANLLALQPLLGNSVMSGVLSTASSAGSRIVGEGHARRSDAAQAAQADFGRVVGAATHAAPPLRPLAQTAGRVVGRVDEQRAAFDASRGAVGHLGGALVAARALTRGVAPGRTSAAAAVERLAAERLAAERTGPAVAGQAAALRRPPDSLDIPMDEAAGAGGRSASALEALRGAGSAHPGVVGLGAAVVNRVAGLRARAVEHARVGSSQLRGVAASQRAAVHQAISSSQASVAAKLQGTRAHITQESTNAMAAVCTVETEAGARIDEAVQRESGRINGAVVSGQARVNEVFAVGRADLTAAGETEARRVADHGRELSDRAMRLGRQEAERLRRSETDAELAADKAEAVLGVAREYASRIREEATALRGQLSEQVAEAKNQVGAEERPAVDAIRDLSRGAIDGVRTQATSVRQGVAASVAQGRANVRDATSGLMGEVSNLESATRGRAAALLADGQASIDAGLAAGLVSHAGAAGQIGEALDDAGRNAVDNLANVAQRADGDLPVVSRDTDGGVAVAGAGDAGPVGDAGTELLEALDQVGPTLDRSAAARQAELAGGLEGAGAGAHGAGNAWVTETDGAATRLTQTGGQGLEDIRAATATRGEQVVTEGVIGVGSLADGVMQDVDRQVEGVRAPVRTGVDRAVGEIRGGGDGGIRHADERIAEVPGAMREAAQAQESWLGRLGGWVSHQLADTWQAVRGMWDWRFVVSVVVGIGAAIVAGVVVASLIAASPIAIGGLAAALIVGAAAGAAGFVAAQVAGNLMDDDPKRRWYDGIGHAAIVGVAVGAAGMAATFVGMTLVAGTLLVMGAAGVGTIVANVASGRPWDEHLLANVLILGIFHGVAKSIGDRIPSRRSGLDPNNRPPTTRHEPLSTSAPQIVVNDPARVRAVEPVVEDGTVKWRLVDSETRSDFGYAEVELDPNGRPVGGPSLTIDPTRAWSPEHGGVRLKAEGFTWTEAALRAANEGFRERFGRGPANMDGLIAWRNLENFQSAFDRIRRADPRLDERVVAERAAREISFGRHRIALGYGDISVDYSNMGNVRLPSGEVIRNVPRNVVIHARPTTPGVVPTIPNRPDGGG